MKLTDLPPRYQKQAEEQLAEIDARAEETKALRVVKDIRAARAGFPVSPTKSYKSSDPSTWKNARKDAPRKYRNEPTELDGERFDSKLEAAVFARLVAYYGRDRVIRQVSFPVGSLRIRPDFLVLLPCGRFALADAKGFATDAWKAKANHLRHFHGLEIALIRKPEDAVAKIDAVRTRTDSAFHNSPPIHARKDKSLPFSSGGAGGWKPEDDEEDPE